MDENVKQTGAFISELLNKHVTPKSLYQFPKTENLDNPLVKFLTETCNVTITRSYNSFLWIAGYNPEMRRARLAITQAQRDGGELLGETCMYYRAIWINPLGYIAQTTFLHELGHCLFSKDGQCPVVSEIEADIFCLNLMEELNLTTGIVAILRHVCNMVDSQLKDLPYIHPKIPAMAKYLADEAKKAGAVQHLSDRTGRDCSAQLGNSRTCDKWSSR